MLRFFKGPSIQQLWNQKRWKQRIAQKKTSTSASIIAWGRSVFRSRGNRRQANPQESTTGSPYASRRVFGRRKGRQTTVGELASVSELLEPLVLLTVAPTLKGTAADRIVEFADADDDNKSEEVHIRVDASGNLEWATSAAGPFSDVTGVNVQATGLNSLEIQTELDEVSDLFIGNIAAPGKIIKAAAEHIDVIANATISTRMLANGANVETAVSTAASGSLTLEAKTIEVKSGAKLFTHTNSTTLAPGAITLTAKGNVYDIAGVVVAPGPLPDIAITNAKVDLTGATVKGGAIAITSTADAAKLFEDGDEGEAPGEEIGEIVGSFSTLAGVAISKADSDIVINGGSIDGTSLAVDAVARTEAKATVFTKNFAIAYGHSEPKAVVDVKGGADIDVSGNVSLGAQSFSEMAIFATQNFIGISTQVEKKNVTVALGYSNVTSTTKLASDSTLNVGGNLVMDVDAQRNHTVGSTAAAYGDGTLATALNLAVHRSTLEATIDGNVNVGGNIAATADLETPKNDYFASSTVGTGSIINQVLGGNKIGRGATSILNRFSQLPTAFMSRANNAFKPSQGVTVNESGTSATINVGAAFNEIDVKIADGARVHADGDIDLKGTITEFPETSAISFLNSVGSKTKFQTGSHLSDGAFSQRKKGVSGAISVGYFQNTIDVGIGANATVSAGDDIRLQSLSTIPYTFATGDEFGKAILGGDQFTIATVQDKLNFNAGIQNAFFTSWSEAVASAQEKATGGMLNAMVMNTHNHVTIATGADVTAGGDVQVNAETANDTINFVGSPVGIPALPFATGFNATPGEGVGHAVMVVGNFNDTKAAISGGATVNANSLLVYANNHGRNISIGLQGGNADGEGFNGAYTARFASSKTLAQISNNANINLGNGTVSVPIYFDSLRQDATTISTNAPQFNPLESYDETNALLTRVDTSANSILMPFDHGFSTGDPVVYDSDPADIGGITPIGGLTNNTTYYVIALDQQTLQLATTPTNATLGNAIDLNLTNVENSMHTLFPGFNPQASGVINATSDEINLGFDHKFVTGQPVTYRKGESSATAIGGLTPNTVYHVVRTGDQTIKLAATTADAVAAGLNSSTGNFVDLTSSGTGTGHSLFPENYNNVLSPSDISLLDTNGPGNSLVTGIQVDSVNIENSKIATDRNLIVLAEDSTSQFSGTGAITKTTGRGAAGTISVDVISRDTRAIIGPDELSIGDYAPGLGIDSSDTVVLDYAHGFTAGNTLIYTSGTDQEIGGLNNRDKYVVTSATSKTFTLGRTQNEAAQRFSASDVNTSLHAIDLGYTHKFQQGDAVVYRRGTGGTDVGGLTDGETYYVVVINSTTIGLADSKANALTQDEFYFEPGTSITDKSEIYLGYEHGLAEDTPLVYTNGGGTNIGGLVDGQVYYVKLISDSTRAIQLTESPTDSAAISLNAASAGGFWHSLQPGFDPIATVTISPGNSTVVDENTIDLGYEHHLLTGDAVIYDRGEDTAGIGNLVDGQRYYVIVYDQTTIALAETEDDAESGRYRYFDAFRFLDNGDATDAAKFDTIDLYTDHGYQDGDLLLYKRDNGADVGLTDGKLYKVRLLTGSSSLTDRENKLQLLDPENGDALIELTRSSTEFNAQRLIRVSSRISLGTSAPTTTQPHFFHRDRRIELNTTSTTGTDHSFRLALDPTVAVKDTHGFARGFTASSALSDRDSDGATDTIDLGYAHAFTTGQAVLYSSGQGKPLRGLSEGQIYYVIRVDATKIQLAETKELAADSDAIKIDNQGATGSTHIIASVLRANPAINGASNEIDFRRTHGLTDGQKIQYRNGGGTSVGGLNTTATYTVKRLDSQRIQLLDTNNNVVNLDATVATGLSHSFGEEALTAGTVDAGGSLYVGALNTGEVISINLAGTVATKTTNKFYRGSWNSSWESDVSPTQVKQAGFNVSGVLVVSVLVDQTIARIEDATIVNANRVQVSAINDTSTYFGAGAVLYASVSTGTGSKGLAGSIVTNFIFHTTDAQIVDSSINASGDVVVDADATGIIGGVAISGSGAAGSLSIAGTIVLNVISLNTTARLTGSTVVTTGNVSVTSDNTAGIYAFAGGISATIRDQSGVLNLDGDTTSVGGGLAVNIISNDLGNSDSVGTQALISDSEILAAGDVTVDALMTSTIWAGAIGLALNFGGSPLGQRTSVGFSLGVNVISTRTQARLRGRRNGTGVRGRNVKVEATDSSTIFAVAGAGAFAGNSVDSKGVGVSLGFNVIVTDVDALIEDTQIDSDTAFVNSKTDGQITSIGVGAAGAEDTAVAGNFTFNLTAQDVRSRIAGSTVTVSGVGGDVSVLSANETDIFSLSGGVAIATESSGNAVGAAIAFNIIADSADAQIVNSTVSATDGSVFVQGQNDAEITTIAVGVSGAGQSALAGSISTAVVSNTTRGYIQNSNVTADRNIHVQAENDGVIKSFGGAVAIGRSSSGLGGALSINVLESETSAYIVGSTVTARANDGESFNVKDWDSVTGNETTEAVSGLAVIASSSEDLTLISASAGFSSGGFGVGVNLAPTVVSDVTHAYIQDSNINSAADHGGDVIVKAHQFTDTDSIIGAAGIGLGGASVGIAAEGIFLVNDTQAWISDTDTTNGINAIYSGGNVEVSSFTEENSTNAVIGAAVGTGFSAAGTVDFLWHDNKSIAFIQDVDVFADGNLSVTADDLIVTAQGSLSLDFGTKAIGASVQAIFLNSETEAKLVGAHTNAKQTTTVAARSDVTHNGAALSAGAAATLGFNGAFVFYGSYLNTRAIVEASGTRDAELNQNAAFDATNQSIVVTATDNVDLFQLTGAAAVAGKGGVGGALHWSEIQNTTDAHIGNRSKVSAQKDITVRATSDKEIDTFAGGFALGGFAGISGAFIISSIGSGVSTQTLDELGNDPVSQTNGALGATTSTQGLSPSLTPARARTALNAQNANVNQTGTSDRSVQDVAAFVGNDVLLVAGGNLIVEATETVSFEGTSGAVAAGLGGAVGVGLSTFKIRTVTEAYIGSEAQIIVAGDVTVRAHANEDEINTRAYGGSAALLVGLNAMLAWSEIESSQSAFIGSQTNILQANDVKVQASHKRDVTSETTGISIGLGIGAGGSLATTHLSGSVTAGISAGAQIGAANDPVGSLSIDAFSEVEQADTDALAGAGGVGGALTGSTTTSDISTTVVGAIGENVFVFSSGLVDINARTDQQASSTAFGVALAAGVAGSGSKAVATISPDIDARIGNGAEITGSAINVRSLHNVTTTGTKIANEANAVANASGGALILGVFGSLAESTSEGEVATTINGTAKLTATGQTGGNVKLLALSHNQGEAQVRNDSFGGLIGIGTNTADVDLTTKANVNIPGSATIVSQRGDVELRAAGTDNSDATAKSNSGSLLVTAAVATAKSNHHQASTITIGNGALIDAGNALTLSSQMSTFGRTNANADGQALGAFATSRSDIDVTGPNSAADISTTVGASTLRGRTVSIRSVVNSIDVQAGATASTDAAGVNADADADPTVHVENAVTLQAGSVVEGDDSVHIESVNNSLSSKAAALGSIKLTVDGLTLDVTLLGANTATADNNVTANSTVTTAAATGGLDASKITTQTLNVRANADSTPTITSTSTRVGSALIDFGGAQRHVENETLKRTINFNSLVVNNVPSPELTVDANGNVTSQTGVTWSDNGTDNTKVDGTQLTVQPIDNTNPARSNISLNINQVALSGDSQNGTRLISGTPAITFPEGYDRVTVNVAAPVDVVLNEIEAVNRNIPNGQPIILTTNISAAERSGFTQPTPTRVAATTIIDIQTAQDLTLAGDIDNPFGATSISAGHNLLRQIATSSLIETSTLTLGASAGTIGTLINPLLVKTSTDPGVTDTATTITAGANSDIHLQQIGGVLNVNGIVSMAGSVNLKSPAGIKDGSGENTNVDIGGTSILLDATGSTAGIGASNALEIQATTAANALTALAADNIRLTQLGGTLSINNVRATSGDIVLTLNDLATLDDDLIINGTIQSDTKSVTLNVGDDLELPVGGQLTAATGVVVTLDTGGADVATGSTANFFGTLEPTTTLNVTGGADADTIHLRQLSQAVPVNIDTAAGDDVIRIGSSVPTLDLIRNTFNVTGGADSDQVILDDSGNTTIERNVNFTSSAATGFDTALTGLAGTVNFAQLENVTLNLGSRNDTVNVASTNPETQFAINAGGGNDTMNVGQNGLVNAVLGRVAFEGQSGTDRLIVDDSAETNNSTGALGRSQISGLGLGSTTGGLTYGGFESLDIKLGAGDDRFTLEGVGTQATLRIGAGEDDVVVSGTFTDFQADLTVGGNSADNDELFFNFDQPVEFVLNNSTITSPAAAGTIHYTNMSRIDATLSNGADNVTVNNPGASVVLDARGGADRIHVSDLSVGSRVALGDTDSAADEVTIEKLSATLQVDGNFGGDIRQTRPSRQQCKFHPGYRGR